MVFDRFFGKKEKAQAKKESRILSFDEAPEWVSSEKEEIDLEVGDVIRSNVPKINNSFDNIEAIIEDLENKELDQEIVKKLENITMTSKRKFCENMKIVLSRRDKEIPNGYSQLNEFLDESENMVKNINKSHQTHGKYLGITYESFLKDMGRELKVIVTIINLVRGQTKGLAKTWDELERIEGLIGEYGLLHHDDMGIRLEGIESERESINDNLATLEERKQKFMESDNYISYLELTKKMEDIESEEHAINSEVYAILGPLKRILKKMHKSILDKRFSTGVDDIHFLETFIEHPAATFIGDSPDLINTIGVMSTMLKAIDEGVINEKKSKMDKSYSIGKRVVSGELKGFKSRYIELESEKELYQKQLDEFDGSELTMIEREQDRFSHQLTVLNEELEHARSISNEQIVKKEKAKKKLKRLIESFNPEITINL